MSERGPSGHFAPGNSVGAETQIKPGKTLNPGGQPKTRKELRLMARESMPKAFERAQQILNDDDAEWRAWLEAGKFLSLYGYGAPPKSVEDDAEKSNRSVLEALTVEELRALARRPIEPPPDADPDDKH